MTTLPRNNSLFSQAAFAAAALAVALLAAGATAQDAGAEAPVRRALQRPVTSAQPIQGGMRTLRPAPREELDAEGSDADSENSLELKFEKAPEEMLLAAYATETGRTLLIDPGIPKATISLRSQSQLTSEEYLRAIETVLVMNGISLVPDGEKFLRVLPTKTLRQMGVKTALEDPEGGSYEENGRMVSQMISLKHITIDEAKKALEGFKRDSGQIQLFERTNSILVTDTAENVNRMMEIIRFIDQPIENREETNVRPLKYAKAADIKKRLEEIVAEAQKEQQQKKEAAVAKSSGSPGIVREAVNTPPGVIRPGLRRPQQQASTAEEANAIHETLVADAERGVIRGKVQIVADERTNLLIIITRPENMAFFDRIIDVLDVEVQTAPDVIVEVMRLEYAIAKDVASMLNDLIGNRTSKDDSQDAKSTVADKNDDGGSSSLADAADRTRRRNTPATESETKKGRLGELNKDNVTILADERSNAIVVMAAPEDVETIRSIIERMDIQLSQVVIEAVIASITFEDSQETGMDWVQRAMLGYTGNGSGAPQLAFATAGGGGSLTPKATATLTATDSISSAGGATGWLTFFDLNLDVVLKAIQSDSRSRIMSSPRITTMDNKEATLEDTKRIYWSEGSTHYTSSDYYSDNIKNEDIGIKLKVTPRINKKGYIDLEIEQEIQTSEGTQAITTRDSTSTFPNLTSRKMSADVAVQSGETVVLGGLADTSVSKTRTKVPILGSIPLLGWFFRHDKETTSRREIIVFITPRVIDTPAQMEDDARKIKASMDTAGVWDASWSNSRLADPLSPEQAAKVLENGTKTVAPPRHPLSGYLTGLDSEIPGADSIPAIREALDEGSPAPYVHFSELDQRERLHGVVLDYSEETLDAPAQAPEQ